MYPKPALLAIPSNIASGISTRSFVPSASELHDPEEMSHRIDDSHYVSNGGRLPNVVHVQPSPPPPIATLPQSPSLSSSSVDRSSVSSPAPTRRGSVQSINLTASYNGDVCYPGPDPERQRTYYQQPASLTESPYRTQSRMESRYPPTHEGTARAAAYPPVAHVVPSQASGGAHEIAYHYPGQQQFNAIYTDDATTKLNDRIRRRCFNCCTTDTSTWRRSSLNPGKVLCNKCGLFERTHNRARPEQFPHKRGPLATSSLKVRTSPPQHGAVPPVSALPPHQYNHPSIAPLISRTDTAHASSRREGLPQIQSWLPSSTTPAAPISYRSRSP
ncbi:hypothetical protein F5148DRAFT_811696 [Russula earlei]|uniref:Uncharacterized protein n=1 Tax=Russula earlei TaxID=71964 RepID=A0ACC0TUV7_9AGAM|nr:hypothetical protein F5148DRAFT_811696 [Russula earlei]